MNKKLFSFALVLLLAFSFISFNQKPVFASENPPQYVEACPYWMGPHQYEITSDYTITYTDTNCYEFVYNDVGQIVGTRPCTHIQKIRYITYTCLCGRSYEREIIVSDTHILR